MARTYIDLHTHSTASDGSDSPRELVLHAQKHNVTTLAITDHDTTAGLTEAIETGKEVGVTIVPGCELAVQTPYGELHILGLWLTPEAPKLNQAMKELRQHRASRNQIIVQNLQNLGFDITYDEVLALAGSSSVGRPHIARVMLNKGFVPEIRTAFTQYLADGGVAYAPKKVLSPEEGVALLKEEGATVSIAHLAIHRKHPPEWIDDLIGSLRPLGLDALEAYHSEHSAKDVRRVVGLAKKHNLLLTGGSDYHGEAKPHISIGRGRGSLYVPPFVLEELIALRQKQGLPV